MDAFRYWAFISYSSRDTRTAVRLHRHLERFRIPRDLVGRPGRDGAVPRRVFPIFRDRDELPLSSDLGASIEDALRASRYLIVLASPDAAASKWVNEEIRYFKSLGRDDRILAVLVRGEPAESFPTTLRFEVDASGALTDRAVEPIAGDLRRGGDGWRRVLLKAIAGITGLGFDAFARRDAKRTRRRRFAAAVAAAVVATATMGVWDHNRLKTEYYIDVGTRFGAPVGIGRLTADESAKRPFHYRLESRQGLVRRVVRTWPDSGLSESIVVWAVSYRDDGTVRQIDHLNDDGRLLVRHVYGDLQSNNTQIVQFQHGPRDAPAARKPLEASLGNTDVKSLLRSEITAELRGYDAGGRLLFARFLDVFRRPRANGEGVFGLAYAYDYENLWPSYIHNLGEDQKPVVSRTGIRTIRVERPTLDIEERSAWAGPAMLAFFPEGHQRVRTAYDSAARTLTTRYLYAGNGGITGGYHATVQAFDAANRVSSVTYLGSDLRPVLNDDGYAREEIQREGDEQRVWYYGVSKEPVLRKGGYHGYHAHADGRTVFMAYLDRDRRPVLVDNCAVESVKLDHRGLGVEHHCFDGNGKPALDEHGVYRYELQRDETLGEIIETKHFGTALEPVDYDGKYHRDLSEFDERGNLRAVSYWGKRGEPVEPDGAHRVVIDVDDSGNLSASTAFGADGRTPAENRGVHRRVVERDRLGNATAHRHFNREGKEFRIIRVEYDQAGREVRRVATGPKARPVLDQDGCHIVTIRYERRGANGERSCFDTRNRLVSVPSAKR